MDIGMTPHWADETRIPLKHLGSLAQIAERVIPGWDENVAHRKERWLLKAAARLADEDGERRQMEKHERVKDLARITTILSMDTPPELRLPAHKELNADLWDHLAGNVTITGARASHHAFCSPCEVTTYAKPTHVDLYALGPDSHGLHHLRAEMHKLRTANPDNLKSVRLILTSPPMGNYTVEDLTDFVQFCFYNADVLHPSSRDQLSGTCYPPRLRPCSNPAHRSRDRGVFARRNYENSLLEPAGYPDSDFPHEYTRKPCHPGARGIIYPFQLVRDDSYPARNYNVYQAAFDLGTLMANWRTSADPRCTATALKDVCVKHLSLMVHDDHILNPRTTNGGYPFLMHPFAMDVLNRWDDGIGQFYAEMHTFDFDNDEEHWSGGCAAYEEQKARDTDVVW